MRLQLLMLQGLDPENPQMRCGSSQCGKNVTHLSGPSKIIIVSDCIILRKVIPTASRIWYYRFNRSQPNS